MTAGDVDSPASDLEWSISNGRVTETPDLASYDVIEISSSGGKDSQAMVFYVAELLSQRGLLDRGVVAHADLGRVEWPGTLEVAKQQAQIAGLRFVTRARSQGDLLDHVEQMGYWPTPSTRYCTADHKRQQLLALMTGMADDVRAGRRSVAIARADALGRLGASKLRAEIDGETNIDLLVALQRRERGRLKRKRVMKAIAERLTSLRKRGVTPPPVRILNCVGLRAEESQGRSKLDPFKPGARGSSARKKIDMWLPVHGWTESEIWDAVRASGAPVHPADAAGLPRASCVFCIYAPEAALQIAGKLHPELLAEYVAVEQRIGHTFKRSLPIAKVAADIAVGVEPTSVESWAM